MIAVTIITETNLILPHMIPEEGNEKMDAIYTLLRCSYIEVVHAHQCPQTLMLADEEGLLKGNPVANQIASMMANTLIVGHVCIINQKHFQ